MYYSYLCLVHCTYSTFCTLVLYFTVVPTPNVTVTAPNTQTVGQPLTLTCNVTTVGGIPNRVDIVWRIGGTEVERMEGVSSNSVIGNSVMYWVIYNISQLNLDDDDREYQCEVVIHTSIPVMATGSIILDVMG